MEELAKTFTAKLTKEPVWLTESLVFLGEIERKNDFENSAPIGSYRRDNESFDDYVLDEYRRRNEFE